MPGIIDRRARLVRDTSLEEAYYHWLNAQPAEKTFNSNSAHHNAFCQFLIATGRAIVPIQQGIYWWDEAKPLPNDRGQRVPTLMLAAEKAPIRYPHMTFADAVRQFDQGVQELTG